MLIWQAARATSAALTYFDPITIDHLTYSDGGLYYNNPISFVHSEASQVFRDRKQIIVSLGTGKLITAAWDPSLLTIAQGLAKIATETENEANNFHRRDNGKMAREMRYFRFNVPELGEKDLAESDAGSLANIRAMTEKFLNDAEVGDKVESCAGNLAEGTSPMRMLSQQDLNNPSPGSAPSAEALELRIAALRG
jgi:predicted acylesterase/phospholipase RssA